MKSYMIPVCPQCGDGPLTFPPDDPEGMRERTQCRNGHWVISGDERRVEVVPRLSMCSCGTSDAYRCPLHVNPI